MKMNNLLQEVPKLKQASLTTTHKHIQLKMETNHQAWQRHQTHPRTMEIQQTQSVQKVDNQKERGGCTDITERSTEE